MWVFALSREVEGNTHTKGGWEPPASRAAQSATSTGHDNGSELAGTVQRGGESTDDDGGPGYTIQLTRRQTRLRLGGMARTTRGDDGIVSLTIGAGCRAAARTAGLDVDAFDFVEGDRVGATIV